MSADIQQVFAAKLRAVGLLVDHVETDGCIHRCGTEDRPQRKDGAYKAFSDEPATLWWKNWYTGDEGTWTCKPEKKMTPAEREVWKKRCIATKAETDAKQAQCWKAAATAAKRIWDQAQPADAGHPYLQRKQVPSYGLRRTIDGRLIVPVLNPSGGIQTLQFILQEKPAEGPDKLFLKGGRMAGGFFTLLAEDGKKDGPLLIAEGYATAASLYLATGYTCLVSFSAGNLKAVAVMAREQYAKREIILCADNDVETKDNPGMNAASRAAQAVGGKLAVCPVHENRSTDFNDLHRLRSLEAVRAVVEEARKQDDDCPMPEGFLLVKEGVRAGLYKLETRPNGDIQEIRLGPPLLVKGMTRGADGNDWGLMLEWFDPDEKKHTWPMPNEMLLRQNGDWFSNLASGGWLGNPFAKKSILEYLSTVRPARRIRCVPRTGWDKDAYVLPDSVYGDTSGENVVLNSLSHGSLYHTAGTLDGWQEIPELCVGNSRLSFGLISSFAGPLLNLVDLEGGGFSFEGGSSTGKTTVLQIAASVWGGPELVRSWRATDNGLEAIAALHNDNVLILDEIGQVNGRVLAECAYMLANGQGKRRSNREGGVCRSRSWRVLFLSSGELGLSEKLAENGLKTRGGQEVRLVGLPVDTSMLVCLHGLPNAGAVADRIKQLASKHYGHAGHVFLQKLTQKETLKTVRKEIDPAMAYVFGRLVPEGADGQVRRVAMRFALCGVAGQLAVKLGILPEKLDVLNCIETCFRDWLSARGGIGASEDASILSTVRLFIEQYGESRFQDLEVQAFTCINRVGFKKKDNDIIEYLILPESFRSEVVRGYSERQALKVLFEAKWLHTERPGRYQSRKTIPGMGRQNCYVIVLPQEEDIDS